MFCFKWEFTLDVLDDLTIAGRMHQRGRHHCSNLRVDRGCLNDWPDVGRVSQADGRWEELGRSELHEGLSTRCEEWNVAVGPQLSSRRHGDGAKRELDSG